MPSKETASRKGESCDGQNKLLASPKGYRSEGRVLKRGVPFLGSRMQAFLSQVNALPPLPTCCLATDGLKLKQLREYGLPF